MQNTRRSLLRGTVGYLLATLVPVLAEDGRNIDSIKDNSFLVEEAYNQEAGVVQHILTFQRQIDLLRGSDEREWQLAFTQEWPLFSQSHQLSYTLPYSALDNGSDPVSGLGDILLNYRLQVLFESEARPAIAPRVSLILPTGSSRRGLGDGTLGYQFNLPVSKAVSDRWAIHGNAGFTSFPGLQGRDPIAPHVAASAIYAPTRNFHLMLESVATWVEAVDHSGSIDRTFEWVLSPGARYAVNWGSSQLVLGLGIPLGMNHSTPDYGIFFYLSFEHSLKRAARP